ncbi:MAG: hypothetical protein Q9219_007093 [cf. Caloplaca sp. 3 TL-2023]
MERKADPQIQLAVDESILDYLAYTAIKALLKLPDEGTPTEDNAHLPLQMIDSFLAVFHALHPNHHAAAEMNFRLRLLQFTYVFTRRQRFLGQISTTTMTIPPQLLHCGNSKHQESRDISTEQQGLMELRDTIPLFLSLSAAQNTLQESTITELWMRLAAGYMAQAYVEQVLLLHKNSPGLLEDIFHWTFDPNCSAETWSDEWRINNMLDADDDTHELWEDIKREHIAALRPPTGTTLTVHLETLVSSGLSLTTFNEKIFEFLVGLLSAHPAPLLTQVESGSIDGLSHKSFSGIKKRAGFV